MPDAFARLDYDVMLLGKMLDNGTSTRDIDAMVNRIIAELRDIAPSRIRAEKITSERDTMDTKEINTEVRA